MGSTPPPTPDGINLRLAVFVILLIVSATIGRKARAQNTAPPSPAPMAGNVVHIPLTIDYTALSAAFRQQLYTDHGRAPLWNGSDRCQYLYAENPHFSRAGDNVKLETGGSLMLGLMVGASCVSPIAWNGIIEAEVAPYITPQLQLKFHVVDLNLLDANHLKTLIVGKGFDLIKQNFIPQLETFAFDLRPAFQQFEDLVKAGAPPEVAQRVAQTLATLRPEPNLLAADEGVRATIDLTMPAFETIPSPSAPAQLTPQELAAFEEKLDQWDAFLVFAIKQMGETNTDAQLRDDLLALLLDSRHRLIDALANPQSGGPDPIRLLFLDEWQRLGEIIRAAAQRGTLGSQSLQFLSFMSAGDALFALDQAAPALGMRISSDDLRRLAHMIGPTSGKDPLSFGFDEDPELRKMFHVKEPLSSEGPLDTERDIVATPTVTPSTSALLTPNAAAATSAATSAAPMPSPSMPPGFSESDLPTEAVSPTTPSTPISGAPATSGAMPPPSPSTIVAPTPAPVSLLDFPLWIFTPGDADAAQEAPNIDPVAKLQELAKKLKRAVVNAGNADEYRGNYDQLLQFGAQHEISDENLAPKFRPLYMRMVKATAWQESCWRQFILDGNRVTYLESSTHDIGLMQVNKYVWRGFYNVQRLEWDVLYNASAGIEILARLLHDIEVKHSAFTPSNPDELARSVYAAYNGGPGAYRRWRTHEPKVQRAIDTSFWQKYQAVQRGNQIDILSCAEEWGTQH